MNLFSKAPNSHPDELQWNLWNNLHPAHPSKCDLLTSICYECPGFHPFPADMVELFFCILYIIEYKKILGSVQRFTQLSAKQKNYIEKEREKNSLGSEPQWNEHFKFWFYSLLSFFFIILPLFKGNCEETHVQISKRTLRYF